MDLSSVKPCLHSWNKYNLAYFLFYTISICEYLFLAALGLRCCTGTPSGCDVAASLAAAHRHQAAQGSSSCCSTQTQLLRGTWSAAGPGVQRVPPALAGGLSVTGPPEKSPSSLFMIKLANLFFTFISITSF